ncbi:Lactose transport system permease protein LacG [compost metagenome]
MAGTAINLLMTSLAAYGLSRMDLMGRKTLMKMITFTMFFGGGMIPTFLLVQNLGLVDTRWAILIPGAISTFYFLIMKTSFESIPISLIESAKLDGANDFLILFRIVLPLSKSILAVMMLYYAVDHWNDYVGPMLYLRSQELYPIQIVMRDILISSSTEAMGAGADTGFAIGENIKYATIIISTLPIMIVYPFIQRFFVQGALIGAVKQ